MEWIKIDREPSGHATPEAFALIRESLPIIVYHKLCKSYKSVERDDYQLTWVRNGPGFTHYAILTPPTHQDNEKD